MLGIALDSTDPGNPEQLAWLEETLANTDAKWKLAALHHLPYSSGFHGSNAAAREAFVRFSSATGSRSCSPAMSTTTSEPIPSTA
jgi:hypothetical protein